MPVLAAGGTALAVFAAAIAALIIRKRGARKGPGKSRAIDIR
jgi:hypothetical protein